MSTPSPSRSLVGLMAAVTTTVVWLPPSSQATVTPPAGPRLVTIGDSVAAAAACDCRDYPTRVATRLNRSRAHPLVSANLAVSGADTGDTLARLSSPTSREALAHARFVLVQIGANDFAESDLTDRDCVASHLVCQDGELLGLTDNLDRILTIVDQTTPRHTDVVVLGYWNVFKDGRVGAKLGRRTSPRVQP